MVLTDRKSNGQKCMITISPVADQARRILVCIAECDLPVLLVGEPGVGKRTAAKEIHAQSRRSRQPFQEFSCRELDEQILRSTLKLNGTAYLADVGELSPGLREILTEEYFRNAQEQNCRLLFGSSCELIDDVKAQRMSEEFFYLVSAITIRLSPLRVRRREILSIADALLAHYSMQFDRPKPALSPEVITFLIAHKWPDNLPELETAIKTFVAIGDQEISLAALRAHSPQRSNGHRETQSLKDATRRASVEVERQLISRVLSSNGGNRKRAASDLGISYKTLLYKIKQVGLEETSTHSRSGATQ